MDIQFTTQILKEGNTFVAYAPELDLSSCGKTIQEAKVHLTEAVTLFIEEAQRMGTLQDILEEAVKSFLVRRSVPLRPQPMTLPRRVRRRA